MSDFKKWLEKNKIPASIVYGRVPTVSVRALGEWFLEEHTKNKAKVQQHKRKYKVWGRRLKRVDLKRGHFANRMKNFAIACLGKQEVEKRLKEPGKK